MDDWNGNLWTKLCIMLKIDRLLNLIVIIFNLGKVSKIHTLIQSIFERQSLCWWKTQAVTWVVLKSPFPFPKWKGGKKYYRFFKKGLNFGYSLIFNIFLGIPNIWLQLLTTVHIGLRKLCVFCYYDSFDNHKEQNNNLWLWYFHTDGCKTLSKTLN